MLSAPGVCSGLLPSGRVWARYEGQKASARSALRPLPVQQPQPVMWPGHGRMSGEEHIQISDNKHRSSCLRCWCHCVQGCQHNTAGEHCHVCAAGHYGTVQGSVSDCSLCACPLRGQRWGHMVTCSSSGDWPIETVLEIGQLENGEKKTEHVCFSEIWKI